MGGDPVNSVDPLGLAETGANIGGAIGGVIGTWGGGVLGGLGGGAGGTAILPGVGTFAGAISGAEAGAAAGAAAGGLAGIGIGSYFGSKIEDACSATSGSGRWSCTASCNVQVINPILDRIAPSRVTGSARGKTEPEACAEAKRTATQSAPPGTYARHCQCSCSKS